MPVKEELRTDDVLRQKERERGLRAKRISLDIAPQQVETTESVFDTLKRAGVNQDKGGINKAVISHRSDPVTSLYDSEGRERIIPAGSAKVCLSEGLFLACPICGDEHEGNDPNCCPGRERVKFRRCPVAGCGKKFYDDRVDAQAAISDDPDMIPTELPSTPEARTKAKMEAHLVAYHEEAARRAGLMTADSARR